MNGDFTIRTTVVVDAMRAIDPDPFWWRMTLRRERLDERKDDKQVCRLLAVMGCYDHDPQHRFSYNRTELGRRVHEALESEVA